MKFTLRTLIVFTTLALIASPRLGALPDAEAAAGRKSRETAFAVHRPDKSPVLIFGVIGA